VVLVSPLRFGSTTFLLLSFFSTFLSFIPKYQFLELLKKNPCCVACVCKVHNRNTLPPQLGRENAIIFESIEVANAAG
jgi:hypothetical protein